jgi:hypothetical protein
MQRAICCRIFTPAALPENPAASLRDYCPGVLKHLHCYLAEFNFRYSSRAKLGVNDHECTARALKTHLGKRAYLSRAGNRVALWEKSPQRKKSDRKGLIQRNSSGSWRALESAALVRVWNSLRRSFARSFQLNSPSKARIEHCQVGLWFGPNSQLNFMLVPGIRVE